MLLRFQGLCGLLVVPQFLGYGMMLLHFPSPAAVHEEILIALQFDINSPRYHSPQRGV
jgi:hypothetical protein